VNLPIQSQRGRHARKYKVNHSFFKDINTEEKAYWLGFIYADGCVRNNLLLIGLSELDQCHLHRFTRSLDSDYKISLKKIYNHKLRKEYRSANIQICSQEIYQDLLSKGVTPRKSATLQFPAQNIVPSYLLRHFIRGYFDGDGSIFRNASTFVFSVVSSPLFNLGLSEILKEELGLAPTFSSNVKTNKVNYLSYYSLYNLTKLYDYLYLDCSVCLSRKKIKWESFGRSLFKNRASQEIDAIHKLLFKPTSIKEVSEALNVTYDRAKYLMRQMEGQQLVKKSVVNGINNYVGIKT
jgi:hypothetical protein